jgi:hypothetical protein
MDDAAIRKHTMICGTDACRCDVCVIAAEAIARGSELSVFRNAGHDESCVGMDEREGRCGCGYLQRAGAHAALLAAWAEVAALRAERDRRDADEAADTTLEERDSAEEALEKTYRALGGDRDDLWFYSTEHPAPPDSGELRLDVPHLAEAMAARAKAAESEARRLRSDPRASLAVRLAEVMASDLGETGSTGVDAWDAALAAWRTLAPEPAICAICDGGPANDCACVCPDGGAPEPAPEALRVSDHNKNLALCPNPREADGSFWCGCRPYATMSELRRRWDAKPESAPSEKAPTISDEPCPTCGGSGLGEEWDHERLDDAGRPTLKPCPRCAEGGSHD